MYPQVTQMPTVGYNAVYASAASRFSMSEAVALHARLEAACDDLIQKQDALIRAVALRCRQPLPEPGDPADRTLAILSNVPHAARAKGNLSDGTPLDAFAPLASVKFAHEASESEAEKIEALEFEIAQMRAALRKVEVEIQKYSPTTLSDIARKLKFLSTLLVDGGEVDLDAFARLAEVGADMLLDTVTASGFS